MGQKKRKQKQRQKAKAETGEQLSETKDEPSSSLLGETGQSSVETAQPSVETEQSSVELSGIGQRDGQTDRELPSETKHKTEKRNLSGPGDMAGPACVYNHGALNSVNLFPGAKLVNHGSISLPSVCADEMRKLETCLAADIETSTIYIRHTVEDTEKELKACNQDCTNEVLSTMKKTTESVNSEIQLTETNLAANIEKSKIDIMTSVEGTEMALKDCIYDCSTGVVSTMKKHTESVNSDIKSTLQEIRHSLKSGAVLPSVDNIAPSRMLVMNSFRDRMKQFKSGHGFILLTDEIEFVQNIDCLGFVNWLAVFDFDKRGWETGLLSRIKDRLQQNAYLNHVCWQDTKFSILDDKVTWISLMGISNRPDTVLDNDFNKWKRKVKANLTQQMNQIKKFSELCTPLTVLVIWPLSATKYGHIRVVIETMTETLDDIDVVVAVPSNHPNPDESNLSLLKEYYTIIPIDLQDVCKVIMTQCSPKAHNSPTICKLPTSDGFNCPIITIDDAKWLHEDLAVLYLDSYEDYSIEQLEKEEKMFYKGGTLSWAARYAGRSTHADIERDNHKRILNYIKSRHIHVCKSGIIKLYHNPGSGGTTLAQRIVWDLKEETPCVHVKHRLGSSVPDICNKMKHLHDKTHLPILALFDGEDDQRVESILQTLQRESVCIIVLYIQRYWPYIHFNEENTRNNCQTFFLQNHVSCQEAKLLERQHRKDQSLSREQERSLSKVISKCLTDKVSLFEFGLAVHSYNYNGLSKYVADYLKLDRNKNQLQSWHKALSYLSLVYFFGQSSLPCRLFADLPGMEHIYCIDDFPMEMHGIVVSDTNDRKPNMVRISHYLVAKEILNQLLPFPKQTKEDISPYLSVDAKRNLEKISVEFIVFARRSTAEHSSSMAHIMTKTFITRNNKQVGETEVMESKKKRPQLSPLIEQASSKPPFTERFNIYQKLTEYFPKVAQFKAHLGRLFSICRPEQEDCAEKHLCTALEESLAETRDLVEDEISNSKKIELMHIYHMYGSMIKRKLSKYTGIAHGESKRVEDFDNVSKLLITDIQRACSYFTDCRKVTPLGSEQCFYYVSEIHVRLMFCEFVNTNSGYQNVLEFLDKKDNEAADFIRDSCIVMDELFLECFSVIEPEHMDDSIGNCQEWYSTLFQRIPGYFIPNIADGVQSRRLEIARIKMKYSQPKKYGVLELITNANDIQQIAKRYEMNIEEYETQENPSVTKVQMNMDYMEWMYIIRHKHYNTPVGIEHVLQKVELWHENVRSPQSLFYLFVLKSLLGFGLESNGSHVLLIEAKKLRDKVLKYSRHVAKPKYPREWLGLPRDDIRRLYPGLRFFGQIEGRDITSDEHLEIRKGTILPPNDKLSSGNIDLDLGPNNRFSVSVFFIPARTENLKGPLNKGVRVEFVLGFSLSHGYEAFNVKRISTVECPVCKIAIEKRSSDKQVKCQKCGRIFKVGRVS